MSRKTSTAALDSFRPATLQKTCRGPRHPAGANFVGPGFSRDTNASKELDVSP